MLFRVILVLFLAVFTQEASSAIPRPTLRRQISFNTTQAQPASLVQARLVQLDKDTFAVVNIASRLLMMTVFTSNWTQSESFSYPTPALLQQEFLAFSGPNKTLIFMAEQLVIISIPVIPYTSLSVSQLLLKIDSQGQVILNTTINVLDGNIQKLGCRVNEDFFAVGLGGYYSTSVQTPLRLLIIDNSLSSVYNTTLKDGMYINVACDGTYLYTLVHYTSGQTTVAKFHPSDWSVPLATYNTTKLPTNDTTSIAVVGDSLIISISKNSIFYILQLTTNTLNEVVYTTFADTSGAAKTLRYPSYTSDGYFLFPSRLKTNGSWIEYPMQFKDGEIQPQPINTLWTAQQPTSFDMASARFSNDMYGNGYIAIMTDIDPTNSTRNNIMFFGDVCGDGIVSGTAEQCDGGEFCTIKCQCQSGYRPTSPLSSDCVLDTSFVNCSSCLNTTDTSQCDSSRGACVGYRVAPILQCVEFRSFGSRRAYFSYRSNHTASIYAATSNNALTPLGTPIQEFEYGRKSYYPLSSFYVDYLPGTTTVEWFVDGTAVTFDVSDSSLLCPQTLSLLIEAKTPQLSELIQLANRIVSTLAQVMNIEVNFILITTPQNNATQATMFFRADISYDTVNNIAAADAVKTLFVNVSVVYELISDIISIRILSVPNEIGEGVIAPDDPFAPIAWSPGSIGQLPPSADPSSETPSSEVINGPTPPASGWSNNYIAAIILVPLGVGAAIFIAVFFARKKKQRSHKKPLSMGSTTNPVTQLGMPLTELRSDHSLSYSKLPAGSPDTQEKHGKYGPIASLETSTQTDRLKVPYSDLKFKTELGAGAYGKVFIGEWQLVKVALKINTSATGDDFAREAKLMVELRPHPNVVQMLGVSSDGPYPVMILEFCDGGSLDDKLFNLSHTITAQQQIDIVLGIAKGLYHLHKNNIVHRDLAVRNILMNNNAPKISDFGLSRQVGEQQKGTTKSNVGPVRWMAPESLKKMVYSTKSDVWTFGIVVYEIVARREPHSEADQMAIGLEIRDRGVTPSIPSNCEPVLAEIMKQCWRMDPEERPTMEQICDILVKHTEETD
eukprot:TRINITY_DN510_c0_g3_i1.p1 TRINITY_DN510_c0_g3~~TRINITY_DN510_c0_g3_i1.p1  ORF type:complete len:1064 (+),score=137.54 TRINITY_DN510_c0_g3_i1:207-3398(+)